MYSRLKIEDKLRMLRYGETKYDLTLKHAPAKKNL
jgi:hypothetical protein